MPKYERFEDLPAWQEAARLYNRVLDLLEKPSLPLTSGLRSQLDRAALSVSNNIAEGFERTTTPDLLSFLRIAKGSAGEVRSMVAVVLQRPSTRPIFRDLQAIRALAEGCSRQLMGWTSSLEDSPIKGKRYSTARDRETQRAAKAAKDFRFRFLNSLKPDHPLYNTDEARTARGELPKAGD
jgi:four helix bundle protein